MIENIRQTTESDLPVVMTMYHTARLFMRENGNVSQWVNGYPQEAYIREEIAAGHSYLCENQLRDPVGTFCYIEGDDPTYARIYQGAWLNHDPYGTVHRIASAGKERGVARASLEWSLKQCGNLRVDTHRDNRVMQHILERLHFSYCGIIFVHDGTERLAYQKRI